MGTRNGNTGAEEGSKGHEPALPDPVTRLDTMAESLHGLTRGRYGLVVGSDGTGEEGKRMGRSACGRSQPRS
jgi:hypothetical protein